MGILFISLIGWRLIKQRPINSENNPLIELEDYLVEMVITENSKLIEKRALDFRQELDTDTALMGQIDENGKKIEIHGNQKLQFLVAMYFYFLSILIYLTHQRSICIQFLTKI